jgi:hypothetical protein
MLQTPIPHGFVHNTLYHRTGGLLTLPEVLDRKENHQQHQALYSNLHESLWLDLQTLEQIPLSTDKRS